MNGEKITTRPISEILTRLRTGEIASTDLANASRQAMEEHRGSQMFIREFAEPTPSPGGALLGLPVSVKDLFDIAGHPTTCGSAFYARLNGPAESDAGYVARWRRAGATFVGKTNLNEFAYGITGENPWFGDCTQPGRPDRLTGGSSSGAAASVVAGAACVALGTDTGGSLRVPAALCGLVSVRQSQGFGTLDGAFPLAHSFDAAGWLQRHLADVPMVARAVFPEVVIPELTSPPRFAALQGTWLNDIEPAIASATREMVHALHTAGATVTEREASSWERALDLFVPLQAHEAARVHARFLPEHAAGYAPDVLARLQMGAAVTGEQYAVLQRERWAWVAARVTPCFAEADFLVAPAAPVSVLRVGEDHRTNRPRIIGLTSPASLAGLPVLTVPWCKDGDAGIGFQIMARPGGDARLWTLAGWLAERGF